MTVLGFLPLLALLAAATMNPGGITSLSP